MFIYENPNILHVRFIFAHVTIAVNKIHDCNRKMETVKSNNSINIAKRYVKRQNLLTFAQTWTPDLIVRPVKCQHFPYYTHDIHVAISFFTQNDADTITWQLKKTKNAIFHKWHALSDKKVWFCSLSIQMCCTHMHTSMSVCSATLNPLINSRSFYLVFVCIDRSSAGIT